jgi:PAS domain S-box-containing protein
MTARPNYQELSKRVRESGEAESIRNWEEDELKEIFSMSLDMICIADLHSNNLIKVNPAFLETLGYIENELLSKSFMDFIHPDDLEPTRVLIGETLLLGVNVLNFENRYRCRDGTYIWLNWSVHPNLEKGVAYAIARDINARKVVEVGLEKTRMELEIIKTSVDKAHEFSDSIINTVREPLISLDQDLRVVTVSRSFYDFFKVNPDETVGELIYNLGNKQWDIPRLRVLLESILPEKSAFDNYEVEHDFATIGRRTMLLNARQVELGESKELVILLAIEDITERKAIEAGLEKTRKELAAIKRIADKAHQFADSVINTVREPLISLDQDLRVVTVSRSFYDFFKVKPEETVGELIFNLGNRQWDIPQLRELLERILHEKSEFDNYEVEHDFATIGRRTMLLNARQIGQKIGKERVILLAIEDITERKTLEDEMIKAQKLDSLGIFAGGIAHDFNNILTTILGNVSMAKLGLLPEDAMLGMLEEAEKASLRAQMLTKQLLTFSKGGAPVKKITSVREIVELSPSFVLRGSNSLCEISIAADLWSAEVDAGQISQVINNLVINANQALPQGGTIRVVAENLILDQQFVLPLSPGRYIKVSITDKGMGIAQEHLINIFDPYFTTKKDGSGLGLASSYSIIMKHSGHISVESELGVGTTFCIYLPASDKTQVNRLETHLIRGQGKVLVMDDEESLRKMMGMMLGQLGYEVDMANDGAEAIEIVRQAKASGAPYVAAILDLTIPGGLGGKDTIGELLKIDPALKAIVFSGYSDDTVLANFEQYGFKGMLAKPFTSLSMGKVLHDVLLGDGAGDANA